MYKTRHIPNIATEKSEKCWFKDFANHLFLFQKIKRTLLLLS